MTEYYSYLERIRLILSPFFSFEAGYPFQAEAGNGVDPLSNVSAHRPVFPACVLSDRFIMSCPIILIRMKAYTPERRAL